ncbi:MAG TPA: hypothetical protein VNA12_01420 [Mycobacteriales bacterium]|nr:hypothetical protein [Mycobacteriales bacterium]
MDEALPKSNSRLTIGLVLLVAAMGVGTAGALLLRRSRTRLI